MKLISVITSIILIVEVLFLSLSFGRSSSNFIDISKIFNFFTIAFFIVNCFVVVIFYLSTLGRKKERSELLSTVLLPLIIFVIPLNSSTIKNEQTRERSRKMEIYREKMGDNLVPFYAGEGTIEEQQVQKLREEFVNTYTNYTDRYNVATPDICVKVNRSFVSDDMHYIIVTCEIDDHSLRRYVLSTMVNGKLLHNFDDHQSLEKYAVMSFPYSGLLSEDEFSSFYYDSVDDIHYGIYKNKFYLINIPKMKLNNFIDISSSDMLNRFETLKETNITNQNFNSTISTDIIEFQKQHETLFRNNRIVKLAYHLVTTQQCNQANEAFLFNDEYVVITCDTGSYAFKYKIFADALSYSFSKPLIIKIPFIQEDDNNDYISNMVNACQKSYQINFEQDKTLDVKKIKQVLADCDNDEVYPYDSCLGIYKGQLIRQPKVNYFNLLVFHVKDEPMSSQCVVTVSNTIADEIEKPYCPFSK